jgi:hypothetical protein
MRWSLLHRRLFSSCVCPEKRQEEEKQSEQSQSVDLIPILCQRNPHFFEILRVHSQERRFLASRREQRLAHPLHHLQAAEGERKESGGSAGKKVREGKIKLSKHESKTDEVKKQAYNSKKTTYFGKGMAATEWFHVAGRMDFVILAQGSEAADKLLQVLQRKLGRNPVRIFSAQIHPHVIFSGLERLDSDAQEVGNNLHTQQFCPICVLKFLDARN